MAFEAANSTEDGGKESRASANGNGLIGGRAGLQYDMDHAPCLVPKAHDLLSQHTTRDSSTHRYVLRAAGPAGPFACNRRAKGVLRRPSKTKMRIVANSGYVKAVRRAARKLRGIPNWAKMFVTKKEKFKVVRTKNGKFYLVYIPFKRAFLQEFQNFCS